MELLSLALVLLAAVVAGRAAEAVGIPAVVGEIAAGLLLGPSALDLVGPSEGLALLAELGVLVLLLQVGLGLETTEMRAVGTPAVRVAVIGVVVPFATGWGAAVALGVDSTTALFLGAALVATSVGITARTFADAGVLDGTEARIVLGAAVVDDVLGLLVLSVVLRVATGGGVDLGATALSLLLACGFLVVSMVVGIRLVPPVFAWIGRTGAGGYVPLLAGLVLMLLLAEGAARAELAPLIGALVAGVLLARTDQAERISRGVAPIAALLVPVFFVAVGIDVDLGALGSSTVLVLAGVLFAVGVVGKAVSGLGVGGGAVDRLLVGIGMVPRGEVGLAFAATGLGAAVLDDDRYAAIVVVVLATTIVAPLLIRWRLGARRPSAAAARTPDDPGTAPPGAPAA
ncbi:cation:proton antiporter [Dermatobacter hominis]|uniref:cation:proton antiporter n=1 Tax=Dermatobacter hominis TaxID=2884263 RepID=UPI001D1244FD|nr:cation:proton antiporter [Dermatobacter hominis]UDY37084.1 cation:proton antiporter [Dermatobacter hominis]